MSKETTEKPAAREPAGARAARDAAGPRAAGPAAGVMRMQRALGNAMVQRMLVQRAAEAPAGEVPAEVEDGIHAARGGGGSLDPGTRGAMESALGADFSGVRVHTDARADSLSRALGARAFTTGRDVFFRQGEFSPATPGGQKLIAHELTHVVQQAATPVQRRLTLGAEGDAYEREAESLAERVAAGSAGAVGMGGGAGVQRAPAAAVPAAAPPAKAAEAAAGDAKAEDKKEPEKKEEPPLDAAALTKRIVDAVSPGLTGMDFKTRWPTLRQQVRNPKTAGTKPVGLQARFPDLYSAPVAEGLKKLALKDREAIAADAEAQLGASLLAGTKAAELRTEYSTTLTRNLRENIEGDFAGYVAMRPALLATFGSVAKANEYFATLEKAEFPSAETSVRGARGTLVHPSLKARLKKAADVLRARKVPGTEQSWMEVVEASLGEIGGFNLRENRNNPSQLSDHSFGWAFDLDTELNPNVKARLFPDTLMKALTGEDVYGGPAATALRAGGTVDELLPHARKLRGASDAFKGAFAGEAALKTALLAQVEAKGLKLDGTQAAALFALVAATGKRSARVKSIADFLSAAKLGPPRPAESATAGTATAAGAAPATPASTTAPATTAPATPAATTPAAPASPVAKAAAKGKAKAAEKPKEPTPPPPPPVWAEAAGLAELIVSGFEVLAGSSSGAGRVPASAIGSASTVAAHGFLSLPAELIAALTGSDGGGLEWLGAVKAGRSKDFMHFQLKPADQPALPREAGAAGAAPVAEEEEEAEAPAAVPAPAPAPAAASPTVQKSPDRGGAPPTLQRAEAAAAPAAAAPSPLDVDEEALRGVRAVTAEIGPERRASELGGAQGELKRRWEQRRNHLREVIQLYKGRPKAALAEADLARTQEQVEATADASIAPEFRRQVLEALRKVRRAESRVAEAETRWTAYDEVFASREVVDILAGTGLTPADLKAISATESGDLLKTGKNPKGTATGILQITDSTVEDLKGNVKQGKADRNDPARAIPLGARVLVRKAQALETALSPMPTGEQLRYFLFASYNAGQGTLQAAQAAARAMSRDPASWAELCRPGEGATDVERIENSPLGRAIIAKLVAKPKAGAKAEDVAKYEDALKEKFREISTYPGKVLRRLAAPPAAEAAP
jgi:hypothetical protein